MCESNHINEHRTRALLRVSPAPFPLKASLRHRSSTQERPSHALRRDGPQGRSFVLQHVSATGRSHTVSIGMTNGQSVYTFSKQGVQRSEQRKWPTVTEMITSRFLHGSGNALRKRERDIELWKPPRPLSTSTETTKAPHAGAGTTVDMRGSPMAHEIRSIRCKTLEHVLVLPMSNWCRM